MAISAASFHEVRFPLDIALGSRGGPERRTDIVTLASGREERNARWAGSRRRFDAGFGVKTLAQLSAIIDFFEERRGRLYGFRWKDRLDFSSAAPGGAISMLDQTLGTGDGVNDTFQLKKRYGGAFNAYDRPIVKPVSASLLVAVDGAASPATDWTLDLTTGAIIFDAGAVPAPGAAVTAGFEFDVPVRFDSDALGIDLSAFQAGEIPSIQLVEILP